MKSDVRTLAALVAAGTNNAETADQTSLAENLTSSGRIEDGSVYRLELTPDDTVWANGEGYTEIDANWNKIGEISDVLLDKNGQMIAVLAGIEGFLGVGDRDVILPLRIHNRLIGQMHFAVLNRLFDHLEDIVDTLCYLLERSRQGRHNEMAIT